MRSETDPKDINDYKLRKLMSYCREVLQHKIRISLIITATGNFIFGLIVMLKFIMIWNLSLHFASMVADS